VLRPAEFGVALERCDDSATIGDSVEKIRQERCIRECIIRNLTHEWKRGVSRVADERGVGHVEFVKRRECAGLPDPATGVVDELKCFPHLVGPAKCSFQRERTQPCGTSCARCPTAWVELEEARDFCVAEGQ
jgi:hypothetical protein